MKSKLDKFEREKEEIIKRFNDTINNNENSEYRFSCAMAAILY